MMRRSFLTLSVLTAVLLVSGQAFAVIDNSGSSAPPQSNIKTGGVSSSDSSTPSAKIIPANQDGPSPPPPLLTELQDQSSGEEAKPDTMGLQIRADALREGALSYGARGGLAYRTFEIQRRLAEYDTSMSKAFDFGRLLIPAPSGLLVEPPIVSEAQRAVIVNAGGQAAAVADRIYKINRVARIVTAARNWRLYLERDWGRVDPPPGILLPKDDAEREAWRAYVKQGWDEGVKQAEETYEADLDRMTNDYIGMIRYRELLAQGMISAPFTNADDRGITGGGAEMRVGDRGVTITGPSQLIPKSTTWTPAPRQ
ncbi:MAG: type IV secretory system conjugative DNA transfer family protein [Alphaproteobacteria bacterium]|nr:type IV secretory system conjugative DNA transfer family protein [Alphaproteobacteria bacterium]MBV8548093.1 type IV secretory system conjugative DNA transfer family protein [Alphaproteobacteria bacterium]